MGASRTRNKSGAIGTKAESAVVAVLQGRGWPRAERRRLAGTQDRGDILNAGTGITWEVKGGEAARQCQPKDLADWAGETETERLTNGDPVGILVIQRRGYGEKRADQWWAVFTMSTWFAILGLMGVDKVHISVQASDRLMRITLDDLCWVLDICGWTERSPLVPPPRKPAVPEPVPASVTS